jgi:hypothetical protein
MSMRPKTDPTSVVEAQNDRAKQAITSVVEVTKDQSKHGRIEVSVSKHRSEASKHRRSIQAPKRGRAEEAMPHSPRGIQASVKASTEALK